MSEEFNKIINKIKKNEIEPGEKADLLIEAYCHVFEKFKDRGKSHIVGAKLTSEIMLKILE